MVSKIIEISAKKTPSILAIAENGNIIIGDDARLSGLSGLTGNSGYKLELGKPQKDADYQAKTDSKGRNLPGKIKPFWAKNPTTNETISFSPLEATREFFSRFIKIHNISTDQKLIFGEPTMPNAWKTNYRANIKGITKDLGFQEPLFFPEPFAVYQYFKHVDKQIVESEEIQTVFVIDIGGGTFDCCVIRTTQKGELSRGGKSARPLGPKGVAKAGAAIDEKLLEILIAKAKMQNIHFKENPLERARRKPQVGFLIEDAKIDLSKKIGTSKYYDETSLNNICCQIAFPAESLHAEKMISLELTASDLKSAVHSLWRDAWGKTIISCHKEAEKELSAEIDHYDYVLLSGGSAQLPFLENCLRDELTKGAVNSQVPKFKKAKIIVGHNAAAAVAKGIAIECREQVGKHPSLVKHTLCTSLLNSLYIRIGGTKNETLCPKVKIPGSSERNHTGLVYSSPGVVVENIVKCELELTKKLRGAFYFWFHSDEEGRTDPINIISYRARIPGNTYVDKKFILELRIGDTGLVLPTFRFKISGKPIANVEGQEFPIAGRIEGHELIGFDFGTTNSYAAKFVQEIKNDVVINNDYPEYIISEKTRAKLIQIQKKCSTLIENHLLTSSKILEHAQEKRLEFIFQNNKLEGNQLSKGETSAAIEKGGFVSSIDDKEAINLQAAYTWMLENHDGYQTDFLGFTRELNKLLRSDIDSNPGKFRDVDVDISGVDYTPPPWGSVQDYMSKLSNEVKATELETSGLELAVRVHTKLVAIHPFEDGNGRTARLLMSAILLTNNLPLLILNADEKNSYLKALEFSNNGTLDSLLDIYCRLMEQTVNDFGPKSTNVILSIEDKKSVKGPLPTPKDSLTPEERLKRLLKAGQKEARHIQGNVYPPWFANFDAFSKELKQRVELLHEWDEMKEAGIEVSYEGYDTISQETYDSFWRRSESNPVWFCSVSLKKIAESKEAAVMFQFDKSSSAIYKLCRDIAPVTCTLAIQGDAPGLWVPAKDESIQIREIGYSPKNLGIVIIDSDGSELKWNSDAFNTLVADLLEFAS